MRNPFFRTFQNYHIRHPIGRDVLYLLANKLFCFCYCGSNGTPIGLIRVRMLPVLSAHATARDPGTPSEQELNWRSDADQKTVLTDGGGTCRRGSAGRGAEGGPHGSRSSARRHHQFASTVRPHPGG